MSNAKSLKMFSLRLFILCFVIVRGQILLPVDSDSQVCSQNMRPKRKADCRLPEDAVIPVNYNLEITPKYANYKEKDMPFKAKVVIQFIIEKNVSCLILDVSNLELDFRNFHLKTIEEPITESTIQQYHEFVRVSKPKYTFERGSYMFKIAYEGFIRTSTPLSYVNHGIFKGFYKNNKNESTMFISTRTYPLLAHTLLPCFNEPRYKATFQLKINNGGKYKVISNTPIIKQTSDTTEFMITPSMPPFSLSFTIGDFENISNFEEFAVHVRPDIVKYAQFGLDTATRIFKAYEEHFDLLPREIFKTFRYKLDLIGLPDIQGPENGLGVITFNEKYLIYDEENPPLPAVHQDHVETMAEAIVQQWFGNIFNVKDWKYNWINDGLSIFSSRHIVDKIENNWRSMDQFVVDNILNTVFKYHHEGETPLENDAFPLDNTVSAQKAPATIRMMHHFLTEPVFRRGLQLYFTRNKKNPVDSTDFLNALQDAVSETNMNISLKCVMKGWLEYPGYPVLTVTRDYDKQTMEITQKRFRSKDLNEEENVTNLWHIPINYATAANPDFHITTPNKWINDSKATINIGVDKDKWLILNKQVSGFYRINYDNANWDLITTYLKSADREKIHSLNRAQLLDDALAFVQQDRLDLDKFLDLTTFLTYEDDYITWLAGSKVFEWLDTKLFNSEFHQKFKEGVVRSMQNWTKLVGYEEKAKDEHIIKISRKEAWKQACKYENSSCLKMMEKKIRKWFDATSDAEKNKIMLPYDESLIFCYGLRNTDFELWKKTLTLLLNDVEIGRRFNLMKNLGCTKNITALNHYLNFIYSEDSPLLDYAEAIIKDLYSQSEVAFDVVLSFVMQSEVFIDRIYFRGRQELMQEIFMKLAEKITTNSHLETLNTTRIYLEKPIKDDAIGRAQRNMKWLSDNKGKLDTWLAKLNGVESYSASIILTLSSLFITLFYTFNK